MRQGYLSEYFEGVAVKRLGAVEADETQSNQHEYHAAKRMQVILENPEEKTRMPAHFLYFSDEICDPIVEDAFLTLCNCRKDKPRVPEYYLYFPTTSVSLGACEGDLLLIAKKRGGELLVIIAESDSSIGRQIEWLFGFDDLARPGFSVKFEQETERGRIEFVSRLILENIGITVDTSGESCLDDMLARFAGQFPTTLKFSVYARSTLNDLSPREQPDLIADRLSRGFAHRESSGVVEVDGFLSFSLTVQNRRKSRVGLALENHLEFLFSENGLNYSRTAIKEKKIKPDLIFPDVVEYHNPLFDSQQLTMLGVKSTCKDRWWQVFFEADRIGEKHLLILETAVSTNQMDEMAVKRLQLILPRSLHQSFTQLQQAWLMDVDAFICLIRQRQNS